MLDEVLYVENAEGGDGAIVPFSYASNYPNLFRHLRQNRVQIHAELLRERHSEGLATLALLKHFMEADYFLYLRSVVKRFRDSNFPLWYPWSAIFLDRTPQFLPIAVSRQYAERLLPAFGAGTVEQLRASFGAGVPEMGGLYTDRYGFPASRRWKFDFGTIGTR
jgi:hypothetical protein